jgi:hypothetical protein
MGDLIAQGYPVFFTGDHNEPSSLDWTEATAAARPDVDEAVAWPVSEAILGLGFRDTYRDIHPNPVQAPGITHEGAGDRIDYIYAAGPSVTLTAGCRGGGVERRGARVRPVDLGPPRRRLDVQRHAGPRCRSWSR